MHCRNCGAEVHKGENYCRECGAALKGNIVYSRNRTKHPYRKQPPVLIIVLICVSILFLMSLICYFTLSLIMQNDAPVASDTTSAPIHGTEKEYLSPTEADLNLETTVSMTETEVESLAESRYIRRARKVAEKEYAEYLKQEEIRQFSQKAYANDITLEMLNRQPDYYKGMEVYFGGTVLQAIYDVDDPLHVELRIKEKLANSSQNVIYVSYTLEENETRILEGDYVDMYGTFSGMFTYQSVGSGPITVPHVVGKIVYCYAHSNEPLTTPIMKSFEERVRGNFQAENGTVFSFSAVKNAEMNCFSNATDYGDCIVAYFAPDIGWDENNPPPFYRVTAFQDGTIVIFEPDENAVEGVYAIDDGSYSEYTFIEGSDHTSTVPSSYSQSNSAAVFNENTAESQIGYVIESSGGLKIRSGPSTNYEEVGRLAPLESVTIFEVQNSDSRDWGKIDRGWVCMDYIIIGEAPKSSNKTSHNKVLDQYRTAQNTNFQNCGQYVGESFSYLSSWGAKWDVYYSQIDLNRDGITELLIGGKDTSSEYASIEKMDLFTFSNGIPQRLVETGSLGHRAHLYIYPDGTFATSGSGGASTHMTVFYKLYAYSSSASVMHGYGTDMGEPYYYGSDGDPYPISENEYNALPFASDLTEMNINWTKLQ